MDSGAHGNGTGDDRLHILDAITAAAGSPVYFPAGTYLLSTALTVSANVSFVGGTGLGPANTTAHLKGRVNFGSNGSFTDMKIGDQDVCALYSTSSSNTTFTRCQFRGGGDVGSTDWDNCSVVSIVDYANNLIFSDCNFERAFGTRTRNCNVFLGPNTNSPTMHDILFERCDFGVSNGVAAGSIGFNMELYVDASPATRTGGYSQINFEDCLFRKAETGSHLDYSGCVLSSDNYTPSNGPCHATGCTFYGDGADYERYQDLPTGNANNTGNYGGIVIEDGAGYITVTGNTFYRGAGQSCCMENNRSNGTTSHGGNVFTGNFILTRDSDYDTGITHDAFEYLDVSSNENTITDNTVVCSTLYRPCIYVHGDDNTITGNQLIADPSSEFTHVVILDATTSGNTVTGNTFTGGHLEDLGTGNTVTPNP